MHFVVRIHFFDKNLNYLNKKILTLSKGIRSLIETQNGEFICTALSNDSLLFQFYKIDTNGVIKWISSPFSSNNPFDVKHGKACQLGIYKQELIVVGGITGSGVFLSSDLDGNIIKKYEFDTSYCQQRFIDFLPGLDNSFNLSGYVQHCASTDSNGRDLIILNIDSSGTIVSEKLYNFKPANGGSAGGYYNDYGGFSIVRSNDGGLIFNGVSEYQASMPGKRIHQDALLVKTEPLIINFTSNNVNKKQFRLIGNLVSENLKLEGPYQDIRHWNIFSLNGELISYGKNFTGQIDISRISTGLYLLNIIDNNFYQYNYKFVKI